MAVNLNIPDAWSSYVTQTNLGLEVVPHVLYDTLQFQSGTGNPVELRYFQQTNVTADISNMKNSGMLANPEAMLIQSIRLFWAIPMMITMDLASIQTLFLNQSVGLLRIGNKEYGPWPLWLLAAGNRLTGCNTGISDCFYCQTDGPLYPLFPNLMLSPLQPFTFFIRTTPPPLNWPTMQGNNTMKLQVCFDGQLARSIQ